MGLHSSRRAAVRLSTALERFFAQYYKRHPVNATFTGLHEHDHELPDWSRDARKSEAAEMRALRAALAAEHPLPVTPPLGQSVGSIDEARGAAHAGGSSFSAATLAALRNVPFLLDAELARANLDVRLAEHASGFFHDRNPALWTGEAIFGAVSLMVRPFAPVKDRLPALQRRLSAIPSFLRTMREVIEGPTPVAWTERARRECRAARQLFGAGLALWQKEDGSVHLNEAGFAAGEAFQSCELWLSELPAADERACSAGDVLFLELLQRGHFCSDAPAQLLARALVEMKEQQQRLRALIAPLAGSWSDVSAQLAADHPRTDAYLDAFRLKWDACRAHSLAQDLVAWPDPAEWPIRYTPVPAWACQAAPELYWLFYRSPAPLDPIITHDYLVTPIDSSLGQVEQERRLRSWNSSTITLNHVVHHGAVGHHVQNWHARHRSRSRVGSVAATDCASRIGMFLGGSMAEGWACYATDLMDETGFLTPLDRIAEQHSRVRMLARAVVDIRLHTGEQTTSEAAAFYQSEVGMLPDMATAETTKNSMFPGTALMYWLGTSTIFSLREDIRRRRGATFTLRGFHDELLGWGAIPVPLAAQLLTAGAT